MIFHTNSLFVCYLGNWRSWHWWTLPTKVPDWDNQHHIEEWAIGTANILYLLLVYLILKPSDAFTRFELDLVQKLLHLTAQILTSCWKVLAVFELFTACWLPDQICCFNTSSSHYTGWCWNCLLHPFHFLSKICN